jgi:hypothetical protein
MSNPYLPGQQPLVLTHHAKLRMGQHGVSRGWLERAWTNCLEVKIDAWHYLHKLAKYKEQLGVHYYWAERLLLTITWTDRGPVLITVTPRGMRGLRFYESD